MKKTIYFILTIMLAVAMITPAYATTPATTQAALPASTQIAATGKATISVQPDEAVISLGVVTTAKLVSDAQKENAEAVDAVRTALNQMGIKDEQIVTGYFSIYPTYDYQSGTEKITGYQVSNNLSVTTDMLERVGEIIDTAVKNGVNNSYGVTFSLKDDTAPYAQALEQATQAAMEKAKVLAAASGLTLESLISVSEKGAQVFNYDVYSSSYAEEYASDDRGMGTEITPDAIRVVADVNVVYSAK